MDDLSERDEKKEEKPEKNDLRGSGLRWIGAGIEFCGVIGLFCYLGNLLDKRYDKSPLYLVTGFVISFIGMIYIFYKDANQH